MLISENSSLFKEQTTQFNEDVAFTYACLSGLIFQQNLNIKSLNPTS